MRRGRVVEARHGDLGKVSRQGLAELEVEVHGAGHAVGAVDAERGIHRLRRELCGVGAQTEHLVDRLVCGARRGIHIDLEANERAEDAGLPGGLVRAGAAQLGGAVGGEHDEGHAAVVRLHHSGEQVAHGRARGGHDCHGQAGLARDSERGEGRGSLVESNGQGQDAATIELSGCQGERLRARAGGEHDVTKPSCHQVREEGDGEVRCRTHYAGPGFPPRPERGVVRRLVARLLGQSLLEVADLLVGAGLGRGVARRRVAQLAQKVGVVVGADGAVDGGILFAPATDEEPEHATDDRDDDDDEQPGPFGKTADEADRTKGSVDDRIDHERHGDDTEDEQQAGHAPMIGALTVRLPGGCLLVQRLH